MRLLSQHKRAQEHSKGFTLVEVMVALAVVAVGMGALLEGLGGYARYHSELRQRFWSQNIAWNELSKIVVAQEVGQLRSITTKGSQQQLGAPWEWVIVKEKTTADTIVKLDIRVNYRGDKKGSRLSTMVMQGSGFNRSSLVPDQ